MRVSSLRSASYRLAPATEKLVHSNLIQRQVILLFIIIMLWYDFIVYY